MDDITARLGLDTTMFARALRGVGGTIDNFARRIKGSLSGLGGTILGAVGIGSLTAIGKSAVDFASNLQDMSDNLGISTDFLQDFSFIMGQAGVSTEVANKALEKFSRLIGDARMGDEAAIKVLAKYGMALTNADGSIRSTEQLLFAVADKMKGTTDATEQSAIAFDFFGKASAKLVGQLKQGSEAFNELRSAVPKLTKDEISAIDDLGDAWQRAGTKAKVAAGHFIQLVLSIKDALKEGSASINTGAKFRDLVAKEGFIGAIGRMVGENEQAKTVERWRKEMRANKDAFDKAQKGLGPIVVDPEVAKKQLEFEKSVNAEEEKRKANLKELVHEMRNMEDAQKAFNKATEELNIARYDRSKFTLQELAEMQGRFRGRFGAEVIGARAALALEQQSKRARLFNRPDLADQLTNRAIAIRAQLSNVVESDRFPLKSLAENTEKSALALDRLAGTVDPSMSAMKTISPMQ